MNAAVDPAIETAFDWAALWNMIGVVYETVPVQVLVIIVVAIAVRIAARFVIAKVVNRVVSGVKKKQGAADTQAMLASPLAAVRVVQRTRTLGSVLNNVVTAALVIIATLAIVTTVNPDITGAFSLITAALGAGLGFGAQNIVKDVLSGLFMVAEDQIGVGDVVDLGPATGVVEDVGIRITKIRDVNGTLWFVRNGEILRVGNLSQGWARVIIDLAVPYDVDIDAVQNRMLETATTLTNEAKWRTRILDKPEIWGVESISAEGIVIRIVVKTRDAAKDDVARELRSRLKRSLDDMDVKMPSLNSIMLSGFEGATSVKGARPPRTREIVTQPAAMKPTRKRASKKPPADDPRGFTPDAQPATPPRPAAVDLTKTDPPETTP